MPSLSFFIDGQDAGLLLARLNADPEIAFIVPDDLLNNGNVQQRWGPAFVITDGALKEEVEHPRRWKAARTVDSLALSLIHI